ncbi:PREDICTED: polycystic kidney disease protein 1-like 2 isoform X2 [Priapulus caudatus]|uniref:Polycystic kidney disease protein 1-like 2 isoform X2 n=1 Tax=Priapulus caudatus TaxID=37621 RepID=A0ABM1E4C4_PRICU|nr:PREDICTED: polycystic kidney disease protein 1-like 2 isoform X2 [Priapulus caudatus]
MTKGSATDSLVKCIISGDNDETDVSTFKDEKRPLFRSGAVDIFVLSVPGPLGQLNYVRIWHDNSGKGTFGSWYLKYITISDVQTGEKFKFIAEKWFAVESNDGQVDRLLPVAGKEQLEEFGHLFQNKAQRDLKDGHLWFSVFSRPPKSRFTRLQRSTCCLSLLMTTMLVSAMWYGQVPETTSRSQAGLKFGPFSITSQEIGVGLMSNLIIFPINLLIVMIFRKTRSRYKKTSPIMEAIRTNREKRQNEEDSKNYKKDVPGDDSDVSWDSSWSDSEVPNINQRAAKKRQNGIKKASELRPDSAASFTVSLEDDDDPRLKTATSRLESAMSNGDVGQRFVPKKKKAKKMPFSLPWWFVIIAWILAILTVPTSMFFILLYGIQFGDLLCQKWLSSLFISFLFDVLITQPLKVFLLAVFFSCVCKNTDIEDDDADFDQEEVNLNEDEEWMHQDGVYVLRSQRSGYKPPPTAELNAARETRFKEMKMFEILRDLGIYIFFLWIVWVVSYSQRDPNSYEQQASFQAHFLAPGDWYLDFEGLYRLERVWNWTQNVLPGALVTTNWYNGSPPVDERGFLGDRTNRRLGPAWMRQVRVIPDSCTVSPYMLQLTQECADSALSNEETRNFSSGWSLTGVDVNQRTEYNYRPGVTMKSLPYWGRLDRYPGGGYYVFFEETVNDVTNQMKELERNRWIDKYTRAVFIEFSTYNAYVNLYTVCTILFEFPSSGGIWKYARFDPITLNEPADFASLKIICQIIYAIFVLIFIIKEIAGMVQKKKAYFRDIWNWNELAIIGFSLAAISMYFTRMVLVNDIMATFAETKGKSYITLQYINYVDEILGYMLGFTCFLATLKMIRLLRFNRRMSLLGQTLASCGKDLFAFTVMFGFVFVAFTMMFQLLLGTNMVEYSTLLRSAESSFSMILNKFKSTQCLRKFRSRRNRNLKRNFCRSALITSPRPSTT